MITYKTDIVTYILTVWLYFTLAAASRSTYPEWSLDCSKIEQVS